LRLHRGRIKDGGGDNASGLLLKRWDDVAVSVKAALRPGVEPGDMEIRFRRKSPLDVGDLDVVIEVRTKLFEHRVQDKQQRADLIRDRLSRLPLGQIGVG
jgi:hypothetical protein